MPTMRPWHSTDGISLPIHHCQTKINILRRRFGSVHPLLSHNHHHSAKKGTHPDCPHHGGGKQFVNGNRLDDMNARQGSGYLTESRKTCRPTPVCSRGGPGGGAPKRSRHRHLALDLEDLDGCVVMHPDRRRTGRGESPAIPSQPEFERKPMNSTNIVMCRLELMTRRRPPSFHLSKTSFSPIPFRRWCRGIPLMAHCSTHAFPNIRCHGTTFHRR